MKNYRTIPAQQSIILKTITETIDGKTIKRMERTTINNSTPGQSIEEKLREMKESKEPIATRADVIYTERSEGVRPELDIRADKFDIMLERTTKATEIQRELREKGIEMKKNKNKPEAPSKEEKND